MVSTFKLSTVFLFAALAVAFPAPIPEPSSVSEPGTFPSRLSVDDAQDSSAPVLGSRGFPSRLDVELDERDGSEPELSGFPSRLSVDDAQDGSEPVSVLEPRRFFSRLGVDLDAEGNSDDGAEADAEAEVEPQAVDPVVSGQNDGPVEANGAASARVVAPALVALLGVGSGLLLGL